MRVMIPKMIPNKLLSAMAIPIPIMEQVARRAKNKNINLIWFIFSPFC
jgi:hypothetical protein